MSTLSKALKGQDLCLVVKMEGRPGRFVLFPTLDQRFVMKTLVTRELVLPVGGTEGREVESDHDDFSQSDLDAHKALERLSLEEYYDPLAQSGEVIAALEGMQNSKATRKRANSKKGNNTSKRKEPVAEKVSA